MGEREKGSSQTFLGWIIMKKASEQQTVRQRIYLMGFELKTFLVMNLRPGKAGQMGGVIMT